MWLNLAQILIIGYICLGRSFAYIGIAPLKLFIGEVSLVLFLLMKPGESLGRWLRSLVSCNSSSSYGWAYFFFLQFGLIELVRGLSRGYDRLTTLQTLVFNIYPLFLFLGIFAAGSKPNFIRSVIRFQAWAGGIYGTLFLLYLHRLVLPFYPGTQVPLLGQPGGASFALLGIMYFEEDLKPFAIPLALNAFVMLGDQIRTEWVVFIVSVLLMAVFKKRITRAVGAFGGIAALLVIGYIADIHLAGTASRGGDISTREIVGRALSAEAPELAEEQTANAKTYAGTVTWRTRWWHEIWTSVNADPETALLGHGYGFPLSRLVTYVRDDTVRTPHNAFIYALGYTGWIGVVVFYLFLASLFSALWRCYRITGESIGLILLAGSVVGSFFGSLFDTPFGAIPVFILTGAALAPIANAYESTFHSTLTESFWRPLPDGTLRQSPQLLSQVLYK